MNNKWVRSAVMFGSIAAFAAAGTVATVVVVKGRGTGTVVVSNVHELITAISSQPGYDTIVISREGSPYDLGEQPSMSRLGHLVVEKGITIRGQTGRAEDVVLVGTTNRILYVKSVGCKVYGITFQGGDCTQSTKGTGETSSSLVWGGAIYLGLPSNECRIANCNFTNNAAFRGGAIANYRANDPTTIIYGCRFIDNRADENGGGCYNASRVFNCQFVGNEATKYGGAAYNSIIVQGTIKNNIASKGSELYVGDAIGNASRFHNVTMDRSKISATNGYVFSGYFDVRNSAITDGRDFYLSSSISGRDGTRYFFEYDEDGGTNRYYDVTGWWNSRFFNCTIANNKRYQLVKPIEYPSDYIDVVNSILYGNTVLENEGIRVDKYLATNGCYRTVEMSNAQRFVALGWDPANDGYNTTVTCPSGTVSLVASDYGEDESDANWMNNQYGGTTIYNRFEDTEIDAHISYNQYFHARGWNGDTSKRSFEKTANKVIQVRDETRTYLNTLESAYTHDLTWDRYYRDLGWDGVSGYTGGDEQNYDIGQNQAIMISSCSGCIVATDADIRLSNCINYLYEYRFDMRFGNVSSPEDPYAIDKSSPAYHTVYPSYGMANLLDYNKETWILGAKDLKGTPRTFGGGLDVGAYQGSLFYPFAMRFR